MGDKIQEKQGNDYNKSKECDYLWEEREREGWEWEGIPRKISRCWQCGNVLLLKLGGNCFIIL